MNIERLREKCRTHTVTDHVLIEKAVVEMTRLPTSRLYKDGLKLKQNQEPYRQEMMDKMCKILNVRPDSVNTLADLLKEMKAHSFRDAYECGELLMYLSAMNTGFTTDTRPGKGKSQ